MQDIERSPLLKNNHFWAMESVRRCSRKEHFATASKPSEMLRLALTLRRYCSRATRISSYDVCPGIVDETYGHGSGSGKSDTLSSNIRRSSPIVW